MEFKNAEKVYIAIDLKSFYASVECVDRGLDPLTASLVVADPTRTDKTICLAVSPSLKAFGIPGRARLFEAKQRVSEINAERLRKAPGRIFTGKSCLSYELKSNPSLELDFIMAPPQMKRYMEVSTKIYSIYMKYVSPEDVHVYSIDEVFIDATGYLKLYNLSARDFTMKLIHEVLKETGVTATAGIGTNMYLCKIAMDIVAKHIPADENGVRIAELDEMTYREQLWDHRPLTDFWRVGRGISRKLEAKGLYTMGDVAKCSAGGKNDYYNEDLLYKMFGINAELLIDHAWGWEPTEIKYIKSYKTENNSLSNGQVLKEPYSAQNGRLIVREMADKLSLDLVSKQLKTDQIVLTVCYDRINLQDESIAVKYNGPVDYDPYGRPVPKNAHGSLNLGKYTSSSVSIVNAFSQLYDRIVNENLFVRRMYVVANHVKTQDAIDEGPPQQLTLFEDYEKEAKKDEKEEKLQTALLNIQKTYGKNSILKGMNYLKEGTTRERNEQIGGHKA